MNLDLGLPLQTDEDFRLLHVPVATDEANRFTEWIQSGEGPLLVGGQIGIGKSTFIRAGYRAVQVSPLVEVHFDTDTSGLDAGGYWAAMVRAFVCAALEAGSALPSPALPRELAALSDGDWTGLADILAAKQPTLAAHRRQRQVGEAIAEVPGYIRNFIRVVATNLGCTRSDAPGILAAGVDKIGIGTAAFFELRDCLGLLCEFKTLFEVNAVHLFGGALGTGGRAIDQLCLTAMASDSVFSLLAKRFGRYALLVKANGILSVLTDLSGGNPRQAIRLLEAFSIAQMAGSDTVAAVTKAANATVRDLFAFAPAPKEELLRVVQRDKCIEAGLIAIPGDTETAQLALFNNWILLKKQPESGTAWPAEVNPLLVSRSQNIPGTPEDPVAELFRRYAKQEGTSPVALELDAETAAQAFEELPKVIESDLPCGVRELMDSVGAMLLGEIRTDHVILAYNDADAARAVRAYLFARANTYTLRHCLHVQLRDIAGASPAERLKSALGTEADILSIDLDIPLDDTAIKYLEIHRDELATRRVIWWIPRHELKQYLRGWLQFRQFVKVFVLEDDVFDTLGEDEVEADIAFLDLLGEDHAKAGISHLRTVLNYLKRRRGA